MAAIMKVIACTVVLHDDVISKHHVLCHPKLLRPGDAAYLVSASGKRLCFLSKEHGRESNEVSVHVSLARQFGFENRMNATIEPVSDIERATATHIELFFRDQHLSRADMWQLEAQIDASVLYQGQTLQYLGSHVATVESVYIAGQRVDSACILHPRTKLIFRSGSARYIILVQISQELLQCWSNGDLLYERFLNDFLPDLLRRWDALKVRHHITVVLFGRQVMDSMPLEINSAATPSRKGEDFFHVVATDVPSSDGSHLLQTLKKEFNGIRLPRNVCLAAKGNMLEAIDIAAAEVAYTIVDPPLASTGAAIIAVTAGNGLFETHHHLLRRTTRGLMGNSVGVDIVSLAPKPLHPVPLFRYTREGVVEYALPHWADISYWRSEYDTEATDWSIPGPHEDLLDVALPFLDLDGAITNVSNHDTLETYDQSTFACADTERNSEKVGIAVSDVSNDEQPEVRDAARRTLVVAQPNVGLKSLERPTSPRPESLLSLPKSKRPAAAPHPLLQMGRTISVGAKSVALSSGVASTSISAQHAQHDREISTVTPQAPVDSPSILAKQIRASLRRKPSQASLVPFNAIQPSAPIEIQAIEDQNEEDPASIMEKAIMQQSGSAGLNNPDSLSATPKAGERLRKTQTYVQEQQHDAMCPWLTLLNPCNPRKDNMRVASEYRQWQNVFPRAVGPDSFRWDSMVTPAVLPLLRESRIAMTDLETHFEKKVRRLVATMESAQEAMRRMIALRLSAGFQVVPTRRLRDTQKASEKIQRILLSMGDTYHEIRCLSEMELQVSEYSQEVPAGDSALEPMTDPAYCARVQPALGQWAKLQHLDLSESDDNVHWSLLDDQSANPGMFYDSNANTKMRLVLVPVPFAQFEGPRQLSDEERRIDGIQRLTQLWQRNRYFPDEDQQRLASLEKPKESGMIDRDPDPLAIEYQTRDPSEVVRTFGTTLNDEQANSEAPATLFPKSETYHSSNFDVSKLVKHMQDAPPAGIEMKDRRWLTRFHLKCFRGDEMTNWLLRVFKDLQTRNAAVALGNQLMDKDVFTHVRGKHEFRDGNYFYQIRSAYRTTAYPDTAGFFGRAIGHSVPSTPIAEMKQSPSIRALQDDSSSSGKPSPPLPLAKVDSQEKQAILLSQKLQYGVDAARRSSQLETVHLHYGKAIAHFSQAGTNATSDRIHNPDNCYHIQLDWTTTTPKLIREAVSRWYSLVEGYGLKLVQVPVLEASRLGEQHPLEQPVSVTLALRPVEKTPATPHLDPSSSSPRGRHDRDVHHKAILRKMGFALDFEAADSFPKRIDVAYSWGRPDYRKTQFVHQSGMLLAQISNTGSSDFLLVQNRLAGQWGSHQNKKTTFSAAEIIASEFVKFCGDEAALKTLYDELNRPKVSSMSPLVKSTWANEDVPHMELPPHLIHRSHK